MNQRKQGFMTKEIKTNQDEEIITGENCPCCGYPLVEEFGLAVCYNCGWSEEDKESEGYYEE